jgi:hypothetical protein
MPFLVDITPCEPSILKEYIIPAIIGILSSGLASLVFWYLFYNIKPKIEISEHIAYSTLSNDPAKNKHVIKFINKSKTDLTNVKLELKRMLAQNSLKGNVYAFESLRLKTCEISIVDKFDKKDKDSKYAIQVVVDDNLNQIWKPSSETLIFSVIATHSVSGSTKLFEMEFKHQTNLKKGTFVTGNTFEIEKEN